MTRTPDPANPQPGDRFTSKNGNTAEIVARSGRSVWVAFDDESPSTFTVESVAFWTPVPPPLITEPVVLHHWTDASGMEWGLSAHTDPHRVAVTGRKFLLTPNADPSTGGTYREATD